MDVNQLKQNYKKFDVGFDLVRDTGLTRSTKQNTPDPGASIATANEKKLMGDMRFLDDILNYRDSVHGSMPNNQLGRAYENPQSLDLFLSKSVGKISMQAVNSVHSTSTH